MNSMKLARVFIAESYGTINEVVLLDLVLLASTGIELIGIAIYIQS